ncbi:zinc finger protein 425-like [Homalodisca vitripennis]|uniref:zinc finger protein 425-like n=1 Tax=Homalodisca vitripennis TaxID=197043 RepID=UPI001EEA7A7D|nr:zinc finger protein 425-like [Homalodisca vitripennis]
MSVDSSLGMDVNSATIKQRNKNPADGDFHGFKPGDTFRVPFESASCTIIEPDEYIVDNSYPETNPLTIEDEVAMPSPGGSFCLGEEVLDGSLNIDVVERGEILRHDIRSLIHPINEIKCAAKSPKGERRPLLRSDLKLNKSVNRKSDESSGWISPADLDTSKSQETEGSQEVQLGESANGSEEGCSFLKIESTKSLCKTPLKPPIKKKKAELNVENPSNILNFKRKIRCDGGPGNFKCNVCNRSYKYKRGLRQHQKLECNKPPQFPCPYCPRRFRYRPCIRDHVLNQHMEAFPVWYKKTLLHF